MMTFWHTPSVVKRAVYFCNLLQYLNLISGMNSYIGHECPLASFCLAGSEPELCPPGRHRNTTGANGPLDCPKCPDGYYCPNGMYMYIFISCFILNKILILLPWNASIPQFKVSTTIEFALRANSLRVIY